MKKKDNKSKIDPLIECLTFGENRIEEIDETTANQLYEKWKDNFLLSEEKRRGNCDFDSLLNGFERGEIAIKSFNDLYNQDFYIREGLVSNKTIKCCGKLPKYKRICSLRGISDYYFFNERLNWSFIITHEGEWVNDPFFLKLR